MWNKRCITYRTSTRSMVNVVNARFLKKKICVDDPFSGLIEEMFLVFLRDMRNSAA